MTKYWLHIHDGQRFTAIPEFCDKFINKFLARHEMSKKSTIPIEPVRITTIYSLYMSHVFHN